MTKKSILYRNLEPLDVKELDKAFDEWRAEDDGLDDYPSLGEVLEIRFGVPAKLKDVTDAELLREVRRRKRRIMIL